MYSRPPKVPASEKRLQSPTELTFAEQQRAAKRVRRVTKLASAGLLISVAVGSYGGDVHANQLREQAATVQLDTHDIETYNLGGSTTSFIDGYGANKATFLADKFGESIQLITEGPIRSANFSDAPIEGAHLGDAIVEDAVNNDQDSVSVFGFSTGGILATEAATEIISDTENSLAVELVILAATPSGPSSLRDGEIEKIGALNFIADLPGAKYSSSVRWLISMVSDVDQINNPDDFVNVSASNWENVINHSEPGVRQLDDQALAIMNADFNHSFKKISAMRGVKQMPVIVYLAAEDPEADKTVDNEAAYKDIQKAAEDAGLRFIVIKVPGAVHSVYNTSVESYSVLGDKKEYIQSQIEKERLYLKAAQSPDALSPISSDPLQ